jgi:hypothetical protein
MRSGRTNDLARREAEHFLDPLLRAYSFEAVYRTDSYNARRGLEQLLHRIYQPPFNRINGINLKNANRPLYLDAAREYLEGL